MHHAGDFRNHNTLLYLVASVSDGHQAIPALTPDFIHEVCVHAKPGVAEKRQAYDILYHGSYADYC